MLMAAILYLCGGAAIVFAVGATIAMASNHADAAAIVFSLWPSYAFGLLAMAGGQLCQALAETAKSAKAIESMIAAHLDGKPSNGPEPFERWKS